MQLHCTADLIPLFIAVWRLVTPNRRLHESFVHKIVYSHYNTSFTCTCSFLSWNGFDELAITEHTLHVHFMGTLSRTFSLVNTNCSFWLDTHVVSYIFICHHIMAIHLAINELVSRCFEKNAIIAAHNHLLFQLR